MKQVTHCQSQEIQESISRRKNGTVVSGEISQQSGAGGPARLFCFPVLHRLPCRRPDEVDQEKCHQRSDRVCPRKPKEGRPYTVRALLSPTAIEILERYKDLPGASWSATSTRKSRPPTSSPKFPATSKKMAAETKSNYPLNLCWVWYR